MKTILKGLLTEKNTGKNGQTYLEVSEKLENGQISKVRFSAGEFDVSTLPTLEPLELEVELQGRVFNKSFYLVATKLNLVKNK